MIRTFYIWAYKHRYISENPILLVEKPKTNKRLMPSINEGQLKLLLQECECLRDKALLCLLFDSGLRRSESANIKRDNLDFDHYTATVLGKGGKERKAPFTDDTAQLLKILLIQNGHGDNIWGLTTSGIKMLLRRLEDKTGICCNARSFRRGFTCRLYRKGLATLDIQRLGGWESLQMVQRYTASISFEDCLVHYREKLG